MARPKLQKIAEKMMRGENFELTRTRYIEWTGCDIPQRRNYTENKSAVAKIAKENGYTVTVVPERLIFKKII